MSRKVKFLAEFTDSNGVKHTAIHTYDNLTGIVDMMRDHKFEGCSYESKPIVEEYRRYVVQSSSLMDNAWCVLDTTNQNLIGTFLNKEDAEEYALIREGNSKYLEDIDDDPFL